MESLTLGPDAGPRRKIDPALRDKSAGLRRSARLRGRGRCKAEGRSLVLECLPHVDAATGWRFPERLDRRKHSTHSRLPLTWMPIFQVVADLLEVRCRGWRPADAHL